MKKNIFFRFANGQKKKIGLSPILNFLFSILVAVSALLSASCREEPVGQIPVDNIPPSPLKNVEVEPMIGGGKITYEVLNETDISYVKGEYTSGGQKRIIRSSIYKNELLIEGLGSVEPVTVNLYVVDHSENASEPVSKTFTPDSPLVDVVYESLSVSADFGGPKVTWHNPLGSEIGITLFATDSTGTMRESDIHFSALKDDHWTFKGHKPGERAFAVTITDKWGNTSGRMEFTLSPLYEVRLDKSKHSQLELPGDQVSYYWHDMTFDYMFDGTISYMWHTHDEDPLLLPYCFTVNLGTEAQLSRIMMWHREYWEYEHGNPYEFEIWSADTYRTDVPDTYWKSDEWEADWDYLGKFTTSKPSGDDSPITADDVSYAQNGFEFVLPDVGKARYVRFRIISTWGHINFMHIAELEFYGDDGSF
ncbi:MAG: DUF5126 domain-containing protein [Prevotellaceae bacterium]|jgi:hypothetical protein|nr:DUF5126 domain-containing protein [Prevotellaceae bacterium]